MVTLLAGNLSDSLVKMTCELHLTGKHKALAIVGENFYLEEKRELKEAHERHTRNERNESKSKFDGGNNENPNEYECCRRET